MEWSSEKTDEFGCVLYETFSKKLSELEIHDTIVLWNRARCDDESFARVSKGKLPKTFSNGEKIPRKFHKELKELKEFTLS